MANQIFVVGARSNVKPDRRDELIEILRRICAMDAGEPGTIAQSFQFERANPNVLWEYTVYESAEARALHVKHLEETIGMGSLTELFATWPYAIVCDPVCAKGIALH